MCEAVLYDCNKHASTFRKSSLCVHACVCKYVCVCVCVCTVCVFVCVNPLRVACLCVHVHVHIHVNNLTVEEAHTAHAK